MAEMAAAGESLGKANPDKSVRVAVLGAGMSGICMGAQLKKAGIEDFVILEKADAVGGTWRENTYPGIACDVPSHVYSFSFELNPKWSHSYSSGQEIWDYCERCADKFGLRPHIRFGVEVNDVSFDGIRWQVKAADGSTITADLVVSGLGGLHMPNHANIDGLGEFTGPVFHTAEWNHNVDLKGRRVAMVGTGASAAQVLPEIANDVAEITVFQRSAAWVFPRLARGISDKTRARFQRHPWMMRLYRWYLWMMLDQMGVHSLRRDGALKKRLRDAALAHLEGSVRDPEIRKKLTPDYEPGCKRRVVSDDYLSSFNNDNVHLVTDGIAKIEPNGVRDANGDLHEVDAIIEATGFRPFDITDYVDIRGREGRRLKDVWADKIETLRTMMIPGFPNFFLLLGPNSATGHTSALIMIESQAKYAVKCLQFMDERKLAHLDPDPEIVAQYNRRLQKDMKRMVFSGGCNSWYTDKNDRNFTLWPYSALRFIFEQRGPKPEEFVATPKQAANAAE
jgi:cation diffusion facilitator CzcD-associated flavoprotein CzcO